MAPPDSPAARLRKAIDASPYSIRSLSTTLAKRGDVDALPESIRRSLGKWLNGKDPIGPAWAPILEDQLGMPGGSLAEQNFSRALSLATQLVRRLEAGERLPAERLRQVADETERAAEAAHRFADRLRREASALG